MIEEGSVCGRQGAITALVLWDIDHTLLDIVEFRRKLYGDVFFRLTGRQLGSVASASGCTTAVKIANTLLENGIEPTQLLVSQFCESLTCAYRTSEQELAREGKVLPGVLAAVWGVASIARATQSVVTGNLAGIAKTKIRVFGLEPPLDLSVGAFGDDSPNRAALISIARDRYCLSSGCTIRPSQIVLVGDTAADMSAARACGVHGVGVATGKYSLEDLRRAGAELVFGDLVEHLGLIEFVNGIS